MMEIFAAYSHTIVSLALWSVVIMVLGALSTVGRSAENRCDCGKPRRDYGDAVYRRERAFMNAIETSGPFIAASVAAMLAGASPFWVNVLASVFVVARLAMAVVHIRTTNQPMRSAFFGIGFFCVLGLAVIAIFAAI